MQKVKTWRKIFLDNLSTTFMMVGLFTNPFGFDIVQYSLIQLTGSLGWANFILYCITIFFFILSFIFKKRADKN
jgi:hypothetical protein